MTTKEEALKLAYEMDGIEFYDNPNSDPYEWACDAQRMILRLVEELDCSESYIKQFQLEKQSEPIAWMHKKSGLCGNTRLNNSDDFIPLYTEPQYRELSDEEIGEVIERPEYSEIVDMVHFARAILKKAMINE